MPLIAASISSSSVTCSTYSARTRSNTSPNSFSCRNVSDEPACGPSTVAKYVSRTTRLRAKPLVTLLRINF